MDGIFKKVNQKVNACLDIAILKDGFLKKPVHKK